LKLAAACVQNEFRQIHLGIAPEFELEMFS
jgi:hypothetical protein